MYQSMKYVVVILTLAGGVNVAAADDVPLTQLIATLQQVGPQGKGHEAAQRAWQSLVKADATQLPRILAGMDGANVLAENWLRAAVDAVAQDAIRQGTELPRQGLESFLLDTKHAPRARRTAFEWLVRVDPSAEQRLIPTFLNDPSLELRYDAVAQALQAAEKLAEGDQQAAATKAYAEALVAARNVNQIKQAAEKLTDLGGKPNLPRHFGFIQRWHLVGPFDNKEKGGFDVAYPPEQRVVLAAKYEGVDGGEVSWFETVTEDDFGVVDLNDVLAKHKGAICYAYAEFESDTARDVDLRLGCINANKLWLNGELLTTNNVYHAGMEIDQYAVPARLKAGKNKILLKIAQNEQEEPWAQRWQFQLRVCDEIGTAVLPTNQNQ